jgi:hypothetical protein
MGIALGIASLGLTAASAISEGNANAAGAKHSAQQATVAGQAARANADATDAYYRDDLTATLANIAAIRASVGLSDSPTSAAISDENRRVSDNERIAKVAGIRAQASQYADDAKFYQSAAKQYAGLGMLKAASGFAGGLYQMGQNGAFKGVF